MKLKDNKGYIGIDITSSLIIIVILLPTIIAISYNISNSSNSIKRKAQATSIATSVMEDVKIVVTEKSKEDIEIDDSELEDEICVSLKNSYELEEEIDQDNGTITFSLEKNNVLYKVYVILEEPEEEMQNKLKVEVEYLLGKKHEKITINTKFIIQY